MVVVVVVVVAASFFGETIFHRWEEASLWRN